MEIRIKVNANGQLGRVLSAIAKRIERAFEVRHHRQMLDACRYGTPGAVRALLAAPQHEIEIGRARMKKKSNNMLDSLKLCFVAAPGEDGASAFAALNAILKANGWQISKRVANGTYWTQSGHTIFQSKKNEVTIMRVSK